MHRLRPLVSLLLVACGEPSPPPPDATAIAENGIITCGKPLVFVETNGVTLSAAASDDATLDRSLLFQNQQLPIEPIADRTRADAILTTTLAELAELAIPATRERPNNGPYVMIAIDGEVSGWEQQRGTTGVAPIDCDDEVASNVALLNLAAHGADTAQVASSIQFLLGVVVGLDPVNGKRRNCMNYAYPVADCMFEDAVATFADVAKCVAGGVPQDQRTMIAERLACRIE